jgi:hypothetical protein
LFVSITFLKQATGYNSRTVSSNPRFDRALEKLKSEGHEIGPKGSIFESPAGTTLIMIDGVQRAVVEVLEMAGWPEIP